MQAFQLGGERKLLTRCAHGDAGPPLKSFLFDAPRDGRFRAYAERVVAALGHVRAAFPGLRLDDRVAVVVPDADFRGALAAALGPRLPGFALVDAAAAAARVRRPPADAMDDLEEADRVVLETVDGMDGLERLIVARRGVPGGRRGRGVETMPRRASRVETMPRRASRVKTPRRAGLLRPRRGPGGRRARRRAAVDALPRDDKGAPDGARCE